MVRGFGLAFGLATAVGLWALAFAGCGSDEEGSASGGGAGGETGGAGGETGGAGGETGGAGGETGGAGGETGGFGGGTAGAAGQTAGASCADPIDYATAEAQSKGMVGDRIDPAGDADYYRVELEEGWYVLWTDANPDGEVGKVDTVLSVFTDDGTTRLATMDDSYPRFSPDTSLVYHSPSPQTVCVKVEDWSTWAGVTPAGGPSFVYGLAVDAVSVDTPNSTVDEEQNDDRANAQEEAFSALSGDATYGLVYGMLHTETDVDVYRYTAAASIVGTQIFFTPSGPGNDAEGGGMANGSGSTLELGLVQISDSAGSILASLDVSKGADSIWVPLTGDQDFYLSVQRASSNVGTNDFYRLFHFNADTDNPAEAEVGAGTNDTANSAEALTVTPSTTDAKLSVAHLLGIISAPTDVDYYSFSASAGDSITVWCSAIRSGSGLVAPKFSMRSATDDVMQEEVETDVADLYWGGPELPLLLVPPSKPPVAIASTGTHYMAVSTTGQDPNVTGNFYRCTVLIANP